MDFKQKIEKILDYAQLTPSEFADEISVQRSSISHIISGRNKPSLDFILKIKNRFPIINWDWLLMDTGEMLMENQKNSDTKTHFEDLFSLVNEDQFGNTESEDKLQKEISSKIDSTINKSEKMATSDFQPLENNLAQTHRNHQIQRIVLFFDDGHFESYQN